MKTYTFTSSQQLPCSMEEAWNFLSNPAQLENLIDDNISFQILDSSPPAMYEGLIIRYQIQPFLNIRMQWVTEITYIKEGEMFIDEQRSGPFRFWQHEHRLIEIEGKVEMRDIVHYALPFSVIGRIAHYIFVRKMLEDILLTAKSK